jgi:hypothetical protein
MRMKMFKLKQDNHIIEQVSGFVCLGYAIAVINNRGLEIKMDRFNKIWSTILHDEMAGYVA